MKNLIPSTILALYVGLFGFVIYTHLNAARWRKKLTELNQRIDNATFDQGVLCAIKAHLLYENGFLKRGELPPQQDTKEWEAAAKEIRKSLRP